MTSPEAQWAMPRRRSPPTGDLPFSDRQPHPQRPFGDRVLITEDNWLIAGEWEAELQVAGYSVVGLAVTAEEAVTMARSERPDFVLMDIRLLGPSDGVEAATLIRMQLGIPSIFVSASDDPETRARASAAQAIGWLAKPVLASRLADLIVQLATP